MTKQEFLKFKRDLLALLTPCIGLIEAVKAKLAEHSNLITNPSQYLQALSAFKHQQIIDLLSLDQQKYETVSLSTPVQQCVYGLRRLPMWGSSSLPSGEIDFEWPSMQDFRKCSGSTHLSVLEFGSHCEEKNLGLPDGLGMASWLKTRLARVSCSFSNGLNSPEFVCSNQCQDRVSVSLRANQVRSVAGWGKINGIALYDCELREILRYDPGQTTSEDAFHYELQANEELFGIYGVYGKKKRSFDWSEMSCEESTRCKYFAAFGFLVKFKSYV